MLIINREKDQLTEIAVNEEKQEPVAAWHIAKLEARLVEAHPESFGLKPRYLKEIAKNIFTIAKLFTQALPELAYH